MPALFMWKFFSFVLAMTAVSAPSAEASPVVQEIELLQLKPRQSVKLNQLTARVMLINFWSSDYL